MFFLVRTSTNVISPSFSQQELLAERLTAARWWSVREIREASNERFAPRQLASLLVTLLQQGPTDELVDTGE
jgi:hypothetical protein